MSKIGKKQENVACVLVPEVIGIGTAQAMVVEEIPLFAQENGGAISIEGIDTTVTVEDCVPCAGKVIINALVRKNVTFKTCEDSTSTDETEVTYGTLRHATVTIPVHTFLEVPGALPGDECVVEEAGLEDACQFFEPRDVQPGGTFRSIIDKEIIRFVVKVVRPTQFTIPVLTGDQDICPQVPEDNNIDTGALIEVKAKADPAPEPEVYPMSEPHLETE